MAIADWRWSVAEPEGGNGGVAVQLAPGAHIISASTDAGKLVLHVTTPSGSEVDVFDLATGQLTSQVKDSP